MEELTQVLRSLHSDMKDARPKGKDLPGGSGYRNGFEDGYKSVWKKVRALIDDLERPAQDSL